jgi:single-stranded-DNA-specific exonuclease
LKAIVVLGHEWPEGILGLIAGKLAEKHFKPTFVASVGEGGQIIGSSRSPLDAFYLNKALEYAKDHLTRFGGHKQAAGFASTEEMFPGFGDKVLEFIENNTTEDDFERMIEIDLTLDRLDEITIDDVEELSLLEPHGVGNTKPLFQLKNCLIMNYSRIGKEANHLKLALKMDSVEFEAIGFSMVEKYPNLHAGQIVDIVGNLSVNTWNGRKKLQVEIKHILEVPNL